MLFTKVHRQMRIVFDGPQSIDANTLVNVLIHYTNVVKMVSEEYDGGAHRVSINVDTPKRGSFIIDMSLVDKFKGVFSGENVAWMAGIVTIVGGAYKAYKIMRGRKAETEEDKERITVNAPTNIRNCIINVYNRPETRQAISKSMETMEIWPCNSPIPSGTLGGVVRGTIGEAQDDQFVSGAHELHRRSPVHRGTLPTLAIWRQWRNSQMSD